MGKDAYNIHNDIRKIAKMSSEEINELYRKENVGGNKFEKKLEQLLEEYEELTHKVYEDSAEARLYNRVFGSRDPSAASKEEKEKDRQRKEELEEKIALYKEYVDDCKADINGDNVTTNRVFPSEELKLKVIEAHLFLCEIYANIYYDKLEKKVPYDDIFQTAYLGLHSAARYYIPSNIATFNTYASKCIENRIDREFIHKHKKKKKKDLSYNEILLELDLLLDFVTLWNTKRFGKTIEFINNNNQKLYLMGVPKYSIQSRKRKKSEKKKALWLYFVKIYNSVTKTIGLSLAISNEERDIISQELVHKHKFGNELKKSTFEAYISIYMRKLINAIIYNQAIKELKEKDLPTTDEEIIKYANKIIRRNKTRFTKIKRSTTKVNGVQLSKNDKIWFEYIEQYQKLYGIDKMWYDTEWDKGNRKNKPFDEECESIYSEWIYKEETKEFKNIYKLILEEIAKIEENYKENIESSFNEILRLLQIIKDNKDIVDPELNNPEDRDIRMEFLSVANPALTEDDFEYDLSSLHTAYNLFKTRTLPKLQRVYRMLEIEKEVSIFREHVETSTTKINKYLEELDKKISITRDISDTIAKTSLDIIQMIAGNEFTNSHAYYYRVLKERNLREIDPVQRKKLIEDYDELESIAQEVCGNLNDCYIHNAYHTASYYEHYIAEIIHYLTRTAGALREINPEKPFSIAYLTKEDVNIIKEKCPKAWELLENVHNNKMTLLDFYNEFKGSNLKDLTELVNEENGFSSNAIYTVKEANENISKVQGFLKEYRKYEAELKKYVKTILKKNPAIRERAFKDYPEYKTIDDLINSENISLSGLLENYKETLTYIAEKLPEIIEETERKRYIANDIDSIKDKCVRQIIDMIPSKEFFDDVYEVYSHRFPEIYRVIKEYKETHNADKFLKDFRETPLSRINELKAHHDRTRQGTYRLKYCRKIMAARKKKVHELSKNVVNGIYEQNRELFYLSLFSKLKIKLWDQDKLDEIKSFYSTQRQHNDHFMEEFDDKKEYKSVTTFNDKIHTLEDQIIGEQFMADYKSCLLELNDTERKVLTRWFDENGKHSYTSKEIADELGLDEKEVPKIKTKALKNISKNPRMQKYKGSFLD